MLFGFVQISTSDVEEVNDRPDFVHRVITLFCVSLSTGIIHNVEVFGQDTVSVS